jgi:hypothetical protein
MTTGTNRIILLLILFLTIGFSSASGATLGFGVIGTDESSSAQCVSVLLAAEEEESVAGLQFDLHFNEKVMTLEKVGVGEAANAASKDINTHALGTGKVRVLIAGLNQNVIQSGAIAHFCFSLKGDDELKSKPPVIHRAILSDPFGMAVAVKVSVEPMETPASIDLGISETFTKEMQVVSGAQDGKTQGRYKNIMIMVFVVMAFIVGALCNRKGKRT